MILKLLALYIRNDCCILTEKRKVDYDELSTKAAALRGQGRQQGGCGALKFCPTPTWRAIKAQFETSAPHQTQKGASFRQMDQDFCTAISLF